MMVLLAPNPLILVELRVDQPSMCPENTVVVLDLDLTGANSPDLN
jgi:hypothetical protein